jgi:hypothetical protein
MAHRIGFSVPLGYCLLLAACATWSEPHLRHEQLPRNFWLSAGSVSLLERSYLRCLRTQLETTGTVLTAEEEAITLLHQRDAWAGAAPAFDFSNAPLQRVGRQLYISCSWFLPAPSNLPPDSARRVAPSSIVVRTCDTAGRCASRGQFDE